MTADGDTRAQAKLLDAVYGELHRLALSYMRRESRSDHTLQPTALVNEVYLRLLGGRQLDWESRVHFYVAAAQTMRRILIDHARAHGSGKRSGGQKVVFDERIVSIDPRSDELLALDTALDRLARLNARQAKIVELRFFGGLSTEETAKATGLSEKTVKRDWALARAWLESELR